MASSMLLKPGFQVCGQCSGQGCWHCQRKGYRVRCPQCANSEPEFIKKDENEFSCLVCRLVFARDGSPIPVDEDEP